MDGDGVKLPPVSNVTRLSLISKTVAFVWATTSDEPISTSTLSPTFKADESGLEIKLYPLFVLSTKNLELVL